MAGQFKGQVVFITGASAGIGAGVAKEFARRGAKVVLAARREDRLAEVARAIEGEGGECLSVQCDVCHRPSIDAAVEKAVGAFGAIHVALANAGFGVNGPFERLTTEDYRRQFETNVFGVIDTAYAVLPHLLESKGGLGMVSSIFGRVGGPASSAYCASKFAVCGFAESIYYELADRGVAVTCINPGIVESDFRMTDNRGRFHPDKKDPASKFLCVSTERAAREIVNALYRRKPEATITGHGKAITFIARHFPRATRFVVRKGTRGRVERISKAKRG